LRNIKCKTGLNIGVALTAFDRSLISDYGRDHIKANLAASS